MDWTVSFFSGVKGYTGHMVKVGDFRYSYFLWFETLSGMRCVCHCSLVADGIGKIGKGMKREREMSGEMC